MRIGVISDTHGRLNARAVELFRGVDHIIHAGDVGEAAILDQLASLAPLTAVAGNIDGFRCGDAGEFTRAKIGGLSFFVTHILDRPSRMRDEVETELLAEPADVVVFGHSHLPHNEERNGIRFFNPASAGPRRFDYPTSVGFFEQKEGVWRAWHEPLDERSAAALEKYMNALAG